METPARSRQAPPPVPSPSIETILEAILLPHARHVSHHAGTSAPRQDMENFPSSSSARASSAASEARPDHDKSTHAVPSHCLMTPVVRL